MSKVGIIANPASGKDIRRLVSHATVISNSEKTDILKRVILGLDSTGVDEILIMPDYYGLGLRAIESLNHHPLTVKVSIMDLAIEGNQDDSVRAARIMQEEKMDCIVTLGGDGTNRVVSKGCGPVPLVPISTGTNNVFPIMNEGTTAGIAAGILARRIVDSEKVVLPAKKIQLFMDGLEKDLALIDAVVVTESFIGARALWDLSKVQQIFLTRAEPGSIGMSSIGAGLRPVGREEPIGLWIELGPGGEKVKAPIAPGLIAVVEIKNWRVLKAGERIPIEPSPSIIALDGEREVEIYSHERYELTLGLDGPKVVDIAETLQQATQKGFFRVKKR